MGFQMKEILEKIEVGLDPQESFTEMDKDRDVKNRIRVQVMHLNTPVMKKAPKEIRNRKTEATKNMRKKDDRFIPSLMRKRFTLRPTPMDHALGLKKVFSYKIQKMGVGTLTRLPPMDLHLNTGSAARLPLPSGFLRRHGNR